MNAWMLSITSADERLLLAVVERRRPLLDTLMRAVTRWGSWYVVVPVTVALALGSVPAVHAAGRIALWSLVVSHLAVQAMKRSICRARPRLPVGLHFLIEPEDRFSFPSGHAAAGLSVALPLFLALGGPAGIAWLGAGLLVGVSRCYLGVHYPGDVVIGWTLAAIAVASAGWIGLAAWS